MPVPSPILAVDVALAVHPIDVAVGANLHHRQLPGHVLSVGPGACVGPSAVAEIDNMGHIDPPQQPHQLHLV